jgi:hypothetical protein
MKLISEGDLKQFASITNKQKDDKLLGIIIEQVSARIESFLNRDFVSQARTVYFDAGRRKYYVNALPVSLSPTAPVVTVNGVTQTVDSDYWIREEEGLFEFLYAPTYTKPKEVVIVYTGGYTADSDGILPVPDDIKRACLFQSGHDYKRKDEIGLSSVRMGDGSANVNTKMELLPEVVRILKSHRLYPSVR